MTDENKFFRYMWRFNAVVLACVAIAVGGAMFYSMIFSWRSVEVAPAGHFAPVPQSAEKKFTYRLQSGGERHVVGQEELIALGRWNGSPETYSLARISSGRYAEETRSPNVLAVDQVTVESHWIFKGYNRNIIANDLIYKDVPSLIPPTPHQAAPPAIALVMTAIDMDTNKDGELTEKDRQSLYVYRAGTMEAVRLLTADLIVSCQQTGDRYLVIYENGHSAVAATFSVPEFKLIAEKPLPKVPNG